MSSQSDAFEVCRQWVELVTGLTAIYVRQPAADAPRPDLPYCTVEWPTDTNLNGATHKRVGDAIDPDPGDYDHEFIQTERHDGTLRVEAFGDGAFGILNDLRPSLSHVDVKKLLTDNGLALRMLTPSVIDTSERRDTTWEESAVVDFAVRYTHTDTSATAIIEHVTADVTVTDPGGGAPLDTTIDVSLT